MDRNFDDHYVAHYRLFREYVEHEDKLINHRSTWHHTIQGLLFAALGITLSKGDLIGNEHGAAVQKLLIRLLPVLGILISIAAFLSIWAATQALIGLRKQWELLDKQYSPTPETMWPTLPHLIGAGDSWAINLGITPAYIIPFAIGLAWLLLLLAATGHISI